MPTSITQDANNASQFFYAPDKHRYMQTATVNGTPETTIYAGGLEIVSDALGIHNRYNLSAYGKSIAIVDLESTSSGNPVLNAQYVLTDHLGSMDVVTDSTGAIVAGTGFSSEAFGNRRDPATWQVPQNPTQVTTDRQTVTHRGFTGHEMLDNVGLVHANGRVYDPMLGRFLSVDPVFQFPTNTQSLNPYSYVLNNPLSATDPSGYCTTTEESGNGATCNDAGIKAGDTVSVQVKVSTTETGSHIVQHGTATLTAVAQKDGSAAVYLGNGSTGQNDADKSGTSSTDLHGPASTNQAAANPSQGHYLSGNEKETFKQRTYESTQGAEPNKETLYATDNNGHELMKTQGPCAADTAGCKGNAPAGTEVAGHTHFYPAPLTGRSLREIRNRGTLEQKAAAYALDMPGPGDTRVLQAGYAGELITPSNAHYSIEGTFKDPIIHYLGGGDKAWGEYVEKNWNPNINNSDQANYNMALHYLQPPP